MDDDRTHFADALRTASQSNNRRLLDHYGVEFLAESFPTLLRQWNMLHVKPLREFGLNDSLTYERVSHDLACLGGIYTQNRATYLRYAELIPEPALQRLSRYKDAHAIVLTQRKGLSPFVSICDALASQKFVEARQLSELIIDENILDAFTDYDTVIDIMRVLPLLLAGDRRVWDALAFAKRHLCRITQPLVLIYEGILSGRPKTCQVGLKKLVSEMQMSDRIDRHLGLINTVAIGLTNLCRGYTLPVNRVSAQVPEHILVTTDEVDVCVRRYGHLFEIPAKQRVERKLENDPTYIRYKHIPSRSEFWSHTNRLTQDTRLHRRKIKPGVYTDYLARAFLLMATQCSNALNNPHLHPCPRFWYAAFDDLDIAQKIWVIHRVAFSLLDPDTPICENTAYSNAAIIVVHSMVTLYLSQVITYEHEEWDWWESNMIAVMDTISLDGLDVDEPDDWRIGEAVAIAELIEEPGYVASLIGGSNMELDNGALDLDVYEYCHRNSPGFWNTLAESDDYFFSYIPPIPTRISCYRLLDQIRQLCLRTLNGRKLSDQPQPCRPNGTAAYAS